MILIKKTEEPSILSPRVGPVYQTVKSYNKSLLSKITSARKTADSTRLKWSKFIELLSTVDGLDDKLKSDPEITKRFLLSAISHFFQENRDIKEINTARTIMNNNSVKIDVLKDILGYKKAESNLGGLGMSKSSLNHDESDTFNLKAQVEQEEIEQLEEELKALQDEEGRFDSELRAVESRNFGVEREIRKARDAIEELNNEINQEQYLNSKINELKTKLVTV
jgi:chromosome segregation ATPase